MKKYVVGFMFDHGISRVLLIRKNRPEWQAGLLNGIGGHIEDGEFAIGAMVREFHEETGLQTEPGNWRNYCRMEGPDFFVECFTGTGNIDACHTQTDEVIEIIPLVSILAVETIENLPWLIELAVDVMVDGRPTFAVISYP